MNNDNHNDDDDDDNDNNNKTKTKTKTMVGITKIKYQTTIQTIMHHMMIVMFIMAIRWITIKIIMTP